MTLNRHTIKPGTPGHGTAEHGTACFGWTAEHLGKVTKNGIPRNTSGTPRNNGTKPYKTKNNCSVFLK